MSRAAPVSVATARQKAAARYDRLAVGWATGTEPVPVPALDLPLHPPGETGALADAGAAVAWVGSWRGVDGAGAGGAGVDGAGVGGLVWARRRWASAGDQDVPERLVLVTPVDLAAFAGRAAHWATLTARVADVVGRWGDAARPVLRRHARALADHDDVDHARLLGAVTWFVAHPRSGRYLRQVPVEGLDTKWVESRRALVTGLVVAVTGEEGLGLVEPPALARVRALDRRLTGPGPADVTAPVAELDAWDLAPRCVVVVENLQTFLALPDLPGVMAAHGAGYAADLLGRVRWIRDAPVVYWGDLDRDGFAILDRLRAHCPDVTSVLMDERTLLDHRHLWVRDPTRDAAATLTRLTEPEQRTLDLTRTHGGVRLEQERLAWPWCVAAVEEAVAAVT